MEKKLLSLFFIFSMFFLNPFSGFGQACPTSVSISSDPGTTVCGGTSITFKISPNGGTNLKYQWKVGNGTVGTNSNEYIHTNPIQGQQISVVITSEDDATCTITRVFNSLIVNPLLTPTVGITPTKSTICPGENVSFSASPTNQGSTPTYEWFINGTPVQNGSSSNLNNPSGLNQGDNTVKVVMTSSLSCVTSETAEKEIIYTVKPIATIKATTSTDTESCINTAITPIKFDIGGGGTGATVSGLPAGVNGSFSGSVYTISGSPTTAGNFDFTVTTTGTCEQTSATGSIKVNPNATLSLTSGNNTQTVCASGGVGDVNIEPITYSIGETGTGATVTFTGVPPSGISGSYSNGTFTISGNSSQAGTHNFTVTATGTCGISSALTGSITINENLVPAVSIESDDADNEICAGTPVIFTATPTNGGSSPSYQWKVAGNDAGSGGNTFTTSSLEDGQIVTVVLTSNETCRTENTATSNGISTKVNPNLEPAVIIDVDNTDICSGDSVVFTAIPDNGGSSPTFQWKIGNTVVGTGTSYTTSALSNGQSVTVTMTSSETCVTTSTAISEPVVMEVNENLVPSVSIVSNDDNNIICSGNSITFTATPTNEGAAPEYQWQINGVASGNPTNSINFSPTSPLNNGDRISVVLKSSEECLAENNVNSNEIEIQVDQDISSALPTWDNTNPSHNPTAICPSVSGLKYKVAPITGATSYDWSLPSGWSITNGQGTNEITVTASVNAAAGNITVNGVSECGPSQSISLPVTTGTAAHVGAGPDQTVCPGTTEITLAGEIGGVIQQQKDWDWFASINGESFTSNGFSNGGNSLDGTYTIPNSVRNGGTITIRIQSVKPAGNCDIKTDEMTLTIQSAAALTDPANKNQTVCINSEITPIPFTISGAGTGATASGLPSGVTGTFANGIFTLTGTPTEAGAFNYTVTTTGNCTNVSRTGTLTVNPRPAFTDPVDVFVCAGSDTSLISFSGSSVTGTTFQWTNENTSIGLAASGTGNINGFTAVNTTNAPLVANISVTPIANNCEGTAQQFQITVYPTATFTKPENISVCNGENLGDIVFGGSNVAGTTYKWSNTIPSIGLAAEGTGNISSFSAINTTNAPIEATITVTPVANGCDGTPEEFTITVNPTPAFTAPENIVVCNGEDLSQLDFTGATVTGTTYSWTNSNTAIGLTGSATETIFLPFFTAVNNGNEPVNATITVTPSANECEGAPVTFEITVNPTPEINPIDDIVVCNGEDFSEIVLSSNVTGTSYSWTNSNTEIGLAGSGTGNIPAFSAKNNTEQAVTTTISVIPSANECEGTPLTFNITVNPSVIIEAGPNQTICSNGIATMAATLGGGASEGTWTTSGSGTFINNSIDSEYTPSDSDVLNGSVILTYTSVDPDGPCGPVSDSLELIINKEVIITTEPENIGICSTEPSQLTVIASGDNLSYEWKRTDGVNITNSNGIYSSTLSFNNTTSTNAGEYFVVVSGEDTCDDVESAIVTITVDENIIIDEPSAEVPICGDGISVATMKFIAHAGDSPLAFTWFKDGVPVDDSDSNITINDAFINPDGKFEGSLEIKDVTVDYNGDYYVEITGPSEFACSTAVTNPFQLRLNEIPEPPEIEDLVVCQNETPEAFTVNLGTNLQWYLNENDENFIVNNAGQAVAPMPATDVAGEYFYWVSQTPDVCESEKIQVKVTVNEKPGLPGVEESVFYCLEEIAEPLTASGVANTTLNWYDSQGEALTGAPTPDTEVAGDIIYYVGQIPNDGFGCESERAKITVTVYPLPVVTTNAAKEVICLGTAAELSATGGVSYIWYEGEEIIGNEASISHTPTVAGSYTFTVVVTDSKGCENTADVNVQVDENTVAGTLAGPESVCATSPNGTLILSDYTGEIQRWESSTDGTNWTAIAETNFEYSFQNLNTDTFFRAVVKNGVCEPAISEPASIVVDPIPVAGELNFAGVGRLFMICENAGPGYAVDLNLTGITGEVSAWQYRNSGANSWSTINGLTGTTLSADQIESLNISETTVFQVIVKSGACEQNALSKTAILSVIPTDITPTPVTVNPGVVCIGSPVTLNSETGYTSGSVISEGGDFDNAGIISDGWRFKNTKDPTDTGFDTDANNIQPDRWKRATPHPFTTASLNGPNYTTSLQTWGSGIEDGNKGFAIVSSDNDATMETPVFSIGAMDQAILTFDQAYNLTFGASIKVEISTDGGNSYSTVLYSQAPTEADTGITSGHLADFGLGTIDDRPENKIEVDLGNYLGQSNLRIKFSYVGERIGDVWAVDNIKIPEGPNGVEMEWNDYSDPDNPIYIGNNNSEQYTPTLIGWNEFEVKTKLIFDSEGNACEVAENSQTIKAFVFDTYTSTATANGGTCGDINIALNGEITSAVQGVITEFPTLDGYTAGTWEVVGPSGYTFSESHFSPSINDPNAVFSPGSSGNYSLTWKMTATSIGEDGNLIPNANCPPVYVPVEVIIEDCTTLDFDGVDDYVDLGTSYAGNNSVEAWIRPEATTGTIFSTPNFEITMSDLPGTVSTNGRWYHIAVSNGILYVDGIEIGAIGTGKGGSKTLIGARWNDTNGGPENYFSGWIEEVRIWNKAISQDQIQFMMNQHLQNAANMGVEIPMPVPGGLAYSDLAGYYRLISKVPDPLNLETFPASLMPLNGYSPDLALNKVPARLVNMTTNQENTAPLPYFSLNDGFWSTVGTWARPDVWDPPHTGPIEWNIVRTSNDIQSGQREIKVLGLISEEKTLEMEGSNPTGWVGGGSGHELFISHYLLLNGIIDLNGESQLVQPERSIVDNISKGVFYRDQQGTANSFNYNYWSSPVSPTAGGSSYTVGEVLKDGSDPANPGTIDFGDPFAHADAGPSNPRKISNYWISIFRNSAADEYGQWKFEYGSGGSINVGEGYTMKGTSGAVAISTAQNYTFEGLPNNGTINLESTINNNYLIGNPYPSAIDAEKFIDDNLAVNRGTDNNYFDGALYFWDHFGKEDSHILLEYVGGYASLSKIGGVPAISNDDRINNANLDKGTKKPGQIIPVGQAFFINSTTGDGYTIKSGDIQFKNSQRVFVTENNPGNSQFLRPEQQTKKSKNKDFEKIRISYKSPLGYYRQILVGAHPSATNGFDLGYDARIFDYNDEDMYWLQGDNWLVIQGVSDFNKERVLPLGVVLKEEGEFTIKIDSLENMEAGKNVYIKDILNDTIHNLTKSPFVATSKGGYIHDRFEIIFQYEKELPEDPGPGEIDYGVVLQVRHSHTGRELQILNPDEIEISNLYLFDLNGNLLEDYDRISNEKEIRLPVRGYSSGVYILKLYAKGKMITKKIIISN